MTDNHQIIKLAEIPPELAAAIVAAQTAADKLRRDGKGDKGKYTTSDAIAAEGSRVLNEHGAAWVRTGLDFAEPGLAPSDIGNQAYVGDLVQTWMIVHKGGAALVGCSRMPVITSRGRPPDKATAASLTYDVGQVLRGALCMERENENAIDRRQDVDDGSKYRQDRPKGNRRAPADEAAVVDELHDSAMRDLDAAIGVYADYCGTSKSAVFKKAMTKMKLTATKPADLSTSAARVATALVTERIRDLCAGDYADLCKLAPDDFAPTDQARELAAMLGLDAWPEHPTVEQYVAAMDRMAVITSRITTVDDGDDPTGEAAP